MESPQPGLLSTSFVMEFPQELLFHVLDAYFNLPPPRSILTVLLLSKSSYNLILPKLYHTITISSPSYPPPEPGEPSPQSPDEILRCAKPSSLALTKRLDCRYFTKDLSFWTFSNLTHLFLRKVPFSWWCRQSDAVPNLRLEELFVWDQWALDVLAVYLSNDKPLCGTIQKLGFRNESITSPHWNWLQHCPNLTHIFVLCVDFEGLQTIIQTFLPVSPTLKCFLVVLSFLFELDIEVPELTSHGDRRVALGFERQSSYFDGQGPALWENQSIMWKEAMKKITMNPHLHEVTILD